jgi:hypothetical protein
MNWLRRLFKRDKAPAPAPPERADRINPMPVETALHWSAEDQAGTQGEAPQEWMEKGEPDPRRRDDPNA